MREMKDSGIEWIGEIPRNWEVSRIKYVCNNRSEKAQFDHEEDSYLGLENVVGFSDKIIETDTTYIDGYYDIYKSGDVLFNKLRPYLGKVIIAPYDGFCTGEFIRLYNYQGDNRFLRYWMIDEQFITEVDNSTYGAKMPRANPDFILNMPIAIFSSDEQHRISSYLDAKCSEIDALTADIQSQIDTLEQYKRSVITEAVTKGLDRNVEMKESGIEWAEQIPAHWKVMHNKYLMHKVKEICSVYNGEDILSLTMQGVIVRDFDLGGKMPATFDGYQIIHPGNLLMCLFDYDVTPRCIGYIENEGLTSPAYSQFAMEQNADAHYYYYYYLMLDFTKELLHLAKNLRHSFTKDQLGEINAVVPPLNEQKAIASFLDKKVAEVDEAISLKNEQLVTLDAYKKSTIYECVTGKKEVPA